MPDSVKVTCPWCGNEVGPVLPALGSYPPLAITPQGSRDQADREAAGRFWAVLDRTIFPVTAFDPERFCDDCWESVVDLGIQLRSTYAGAEAKDSETGKDS